jgi:hypothetical protein
MKNNVPLQFAFNAVMFLYSVGWGSIVGIVTCYVLDVLGSHPIGGAVFFSSLVLKKLCLVY